MATDTTSASSSTTSRADAAQAAVTAFFGAYQAQDVERMVDLCTDNAGFRYVPFEVWARQRVLHGDGKVRTVGKAIWTALIDAFPDLSNTVISVRSDDEGNVAAQVSIGGTQAKAFGAIGCTGGRYDLPHLFMFHVDSDGLIDDIAAYWDNVDWKKQLGWLEVD